MTPDPFVACSQLPIFSADQPLQGNLILGRTEVGLVEALVPPTAVEPFQPAFSSRPGPACGRSAGVFQMNSQGKYDYLECLMTADPLVACSQPPIVSAAQPLHAIQQLGRTDVGLMEALVPPPAVEPFQPAPSSRPGPAWGCSTGVFQPNVAGKLNPISNSTTPDPCIASSRCSPAALGNQSQVAPAQERYDTTAADVADSASTIDPQPQSIFNPGQQCYGVAIYYQNVRGLRTKTEDFYTAIAASHFDVFVLTETWLDEVIPSCMLFGNDFAVYRCDRSVLTSSKKRSGGVLIAVKNTIPSTLIPNNEGGIEHVWVSLHMMQCKLVIGAVYFPPDKASDAQLTNRHISCMESAVSSSCNDAVAVFGDYNRPGLRWIRNDGVKCSVDLSTSSMTQSNIALLDGMNSNNMWQMNCLKNRYGNTLDLLFVNEELVDRLTIEVIDDPLVPIDVCHLPFSCTIDNCDPWLNCDEHEIDIQALNFKRTDFIALSQHLSLVDWSFVTECMNLDEAVEKFTGILQHAFTLFVPFHRPPKKPPWSNAELRRRKRRCNTAQRVYRRNRSTTNKLSFQIASRLYRRMNAELYRRHVSSTERNLKNNPKAFWNFVNSKRKEFGLPSSVFLDERRACSSSDKCELFASYFSSLFDSTSGSVEAALELTPTERVDVDTFVVSSDVISRAVKKLNSSYQPGPDGIAACVLKKCFQQLLQPLTHLFNLSLSTATFPTRWKASFMFPVHKKNSKADVRCYRGISSLCACSKLFEIIVSEYLFSQSKHYISTNQHGFFPGRSTTTNLCEFTSFCLRNIEQGRQIDAIYTDLKAAFDKVDHTILLAKLGKLGCSSRFVEWLRSYLCGRKLAVKIGSSVSSWFNNSSGVPQGSNLGPLLFSLYINDAILYLGGECCLVYADDLKLYILVNSIEDCRQLQAQLEKFATWCRANRMQLSIPKCFVISFHRKTNVVSFEYTIDGEALNRTQTIRDLGVTLDAAFSFKNHYEEIIGRARRQLGFVSKVSKEFKDPYTLKALYVSLVRPILETASIVWDPYHTTVAARIESVQRRFIRFALRNLPWNDPLNLPPYESRCQLVGLETLEQRRKRAKVIFMAKLLATDIDAPNLLAQININVPGYVLRRSAFLRLPFRRRDYASYEPVRSMMEYFNDAAHLFDFNVTINEFRGRLRRFMFN